VDACERSAVGEYVFNGRSEGSEFCGIADDADVGRNGAGYIQDTGEESLAIEGDEGFVRAHSGAFAAGEDESG
jgi:hypothetical protein